MTMMERMDALETRVSEVCERLSRIESTTTEETPVCDHEWVSGDSSHVSNAAVCTRCMRIMPADEVGLESTTPEGAEPNLVRVSGGVVECRWRDGVPEWRWADFPDDWQEWLFGTGGFEAVDAWFEANRPSTDTPEPEPAGDDAEPGTAFAFDEHRALKGATTVGTHSPCAKSKRGVVIFDRERGVVSVGWNHQPPGFHCDGSDACRKSCNRLCVHAEEHAITRAKRDVRGLEMLHVKVVDGEAVPSGEPSCWQCSRMILDVGISKMWLLHEDGLKSYDPTEFHELTLQSRELPVLNGSGATSGTERSAVHLLREWQRRACDVFRGTTLSLYDGTTWRASLMWWTVPGQRVAERYCRSADPLVAVRNAIAQTPFLVDTTEPEPAGERRLADDEIELRSKVRKMRMAETDEDYSGEPVSAPKPGEPAVIIDHGGEGKAPYTREELARLTKEHPEPRGWPRALAYLDKHTEPEPAGDDELLAIVDELHSKATKPGAQGTVLRPHQTWKLLSLVESERARNAKELEAAQHELASRSARIAELEADIKKRVANAETVAAQTREEIGELTQRAETAEARVREVEALAETRVLQGEGSGAPVPGKEAEELRDGIEQLLGGIEYGDADLQNLLDRVDARDSLAYLEEREELQKRATAAESARDTAIRERDEVKAQLAEVSRLYTGLRGTLAANSLMNQHDIRRAIRRYPPLPNPPTGPDAAKVES